MSKNDAQKTKQELLDEITHLKQFKQQSDLFQAISDFQSEFIKETETHDFFEKMLHYLLNLTQSEYGFIGQILHTTENQPYLKTYALTNISWNKETRDFYDQNAPSGLEFTNLDTLFGYTIKTGKVIISNQPGTDPRRGGLPPGHPPLNAFLGLPIFYAQKFVGMVGLANRTDGYTKELSDFLNPFLQTCGTLIHAHQSEQKQKTIERELAESKNQLETIFNTVIDGIITINHKGQIQSFNLAAEKIFGYTSQEVIGQNVKCLMPEPYHNEHDGYILAHQQTHQNKIIGIGREVMGKRKDGSVFPMDLAVNEMPHGSETRYVGLIRDISKRKKSEIDLLESEARFRTLTGLAPVGIYETDTQGNCLFVNDRWCELAGLTPDQAAGKGWTNALFEEDRNRVFEAWQNAVENRAEFQEEYRFQKPFGEIIWLSGRAIELNDETGTPRGYLGTIADITKTKEAEANTAIQEERIRALYEVASKPNISFDQQIENVLEVGCQRLGLSIGIVSQIEAEKYIIKSIYAPTTDLESGTQFDLKKTYCSIVLETNRPIAINHMAQSEWHDHPCYKNFQLETYIGVPLLVFGQSYGTLNFTNPEAQTEPFSQSDIDFVQLMGQWINTALERQHISQMLASRNQELEKATKELIRSNQELEQFAYVASHDLQEPLRVITNYLQLLDRRFGKDLNEDAKNYINRVINGTTRMKTLIQDLLTYSRVTTKAQPFEAVDISKILQNTKLDLELIISESNAQITTDPLPTIKADKTQIKQLFQNLLSNAIKFQGDQTPQIHISATQTDTDYQFSVADNGIGIDPQFGDRVFIIFQRLHTQEEYQGTGIGLAICKKIVERHGGKIWLESNTEHGSTFSFTISKTLS